MNPEGEYRVSPASAPVAPVTERVIFAPPPPRRSRLGSIFRFLGSALVVLPGLFVALMIAVAIFSAARGDDPSVNEHYHSLQRGAPDKIAIISIEGAILESEGFVKKQIDHVREDEHVRGVLVRVNSPGGTVTASDYLFHHLRKMLQERKIPVVVSMGGIAASGGYYIAMAAGDGERIIFAEPTTWSGSIGVIIPHYNVAGLMKTWEIEEDSIKSGPLKQMGTPTRALTPEERTIFQNLVDDSFHRFQDVVRYGRPKLASDAAALDRASTGQIFTTKQAIELGLVDQEGFIEDALDRLLELAHLERDKVKAVKYKQQGGFFALPFTAQSRSLPDLATLVDLTSPRAYFLCSWLPPMMAQP